jgi:hypothetical protein
VRASHALAPIGRHLGKPANPGTGLFRPLFRPVPDKRAFARYGFFWPVGAAVFASPLPTLPLPPPSGSWIWLFIPKMPFFDFSPGVVGGAAPVENLPVGLVGPALAVVASAMEPSTATARGAAISLVILGPDLCRQCPALATTPLYTIGSRRRCQPAMVGISPAMTARKSQVPR